MLYRREPTCSCASQKLVAARLCKEGIPFVEIGSGSSQAARAKAVHSFTSDAEVTVFVLAIKTAAVGLTLTCASRLILLEPGIKLADEAQAIGRVHRFGQQRPVKVIKLALRSTVEERILNVLHRSESGAAHSASATDAPSSTYAVQGCDPDAGPVQQMLSAEMLCTLLE